MLNTGYELKDSFEKSRDVHGKESLYLPSREKFESLASKHSVINICRVMDADTETPVTLYKKIAQGKKSFLLESADKGGETGRYSIIGINPQMILRQKEDGAEIESPDGIKTFECENPLDKLFEILEGVEAYNPIKEIPFHAGAVGFMGYDAMPYMEDIRFSSKRELDVPDIAFMFTGMTVVYDHLLSRIALIASVNLKRDGKTDKVLGSENLTKKYDEAIAAIEKTASALRRPLAEDPDKTPFYVSKSPDFKGVSSNMTREDYCEMVKKGIKSINEGDVYQIVLSQRFHMNTGASPFEIYRALRMENPSPYMFFLDFGDFHVAGSSPEPVVRRRGHTISIRPIAGTRPRGKDGEDDERLEKELIDDEKERAEHIMLVDLARNDLGRVCCAGSVRVIRFMEVERYSHVMHMVSEVGGVLDEEYGNRSILSSAFPAGTVSGAPKHKACELIDEFEPSRRGIYAGAVGYLDYSRDMDTCIAIRSLVMIGNDVYVQAGAGIVADSVPEREYEECLHKARAVFRAVQTAQGKGVV